MNFSRLIKTLGVLFTIFYFVSCINPDHAIEYPENNQEFLSTIPETFTITYKNHLPQTMLLNGCVVTQYFEFKDGIGTCDGQKLSGFLKQGHNIFSLEPNRGGPRVKFYVDSEGPVVRITHVEGDNYLTIQGELIDPAGCASLTVNDVFATIDDGNLFSVDVPVADIYYLVAEDTDGRKSYTKYADRSVIVDDSVRARIDESTIHDMLPIAQEIIEDLDLDTVLALTGLTTLFREGVHINLPKVTLFPEICVGEICTPAITAGPVYIRLLDIQVSLVNMDLEELEVKELNLASGNHALLGSWEGLSVDATMEDVNFGLQVNSYVLGLTDVVTSILNFLGLSDTLDALDGNFTADLFLSRLRAAADVGLTASNGDVDVTIVDIHAIGLGDFNSDFSLNITLPQFFHDFGLGLAQAVIDIITAGLTAAKDAILDLLLGNIIPAIMDPIVDLIIDRLQIHVAAGLDNGAQVSALFSIQEIDVANNDTCMIVSLDARMAAEESSRDLGDVVIGTDLGTAEVAWFDDHFLPDLNEIPENLGPAPGLVSAALGYRYTSDSVPSPFINENEASLMVSRNLINQGMLAIYEAGLLNFGLGMDKNGIQVDIDGIIDSTEDTSVLRVITLPSAPPEIIFKGGADVVVPHLILNHFEILFQSRLGENRWFDILRAEITAQVPVSLEMDGSQLSVQLLPPSVELDIELFELLTLPDVIDTDYYINQHIIIMLLEQINLGLSQIVLPLLIDLKYGGETLQVIPEDIYLSENPNPHIGIDANFN